MEQNHGIPLEDAINDLTLLLGNLKEKDRAFAESLLAFYKKTGKLTFKQAPYIYSLLESAVGVVPDGERRKIGDMTKITDLFLKAKATLKFPYIQLTLGNDQIKLRLQGSTAKYPGAVSVLVNKIWVGRVHTNGEFEMGASFYSCGIQDQVLDLLVQFSKDPAGTAAALGKLACRCIFCNLPLTDEKSLGVGYGEICANHWGLPYGTKKMNISTLASGGPVPLNGYYVVGEGHV